MFLYALEFAISQGGIAVRTLALMQGSKVKKKKKNTLQTFLILKHHTAFSTHGTRTRKLADTRPYHYSFEDLA